MTRSGELTEERLLVQSRALGDPTRHRVFAYVRDAPDPVGVAELTEHFGLNHNAIRQHLAKLTDAELVVVERTQPTGPGRPPLEYRAAPGAAERWGGASPYETLSNMLLELVRTSDTPREVGRRTGVELAREHGVRADVLEVLVAVARRLGFEPHTVPSATGVDVVLDRCPFAGPAGTAPDVVCQLHRGLAEGIAEAASGDATIDDLVTRPPDRAGCRIKVVGGC